MDTDYLTLPKTISTLYYSEYLTNISETTERIFKRETNVVLHLLSG